MTCGIYKITHRVSGRCYIGQSRNIENRWRRHRGDQSGQQPRLHAAIKKHGIEAFAFEVIETCKPEHLDAFEVVYIRTFKAADAGYNVERYPRGTGPVSDETKRKIGASKMGKKRGPHTHETRQRIAITLSSQWTPEREYAARRRGYIGTGMTEAEADEAMRRHNEKRAMAAYHNTPEGRAAHMKKMRDARTPEALERMKENIRASWTPERKEKARRDALARWDAMTDDEKKRCTESPRT